MDNQNDNGLALRKADRESRGRRRLATTVLRLALLTFVLSSYWEWNHLDHRIQLRLQRDLSLATANASFLLFVFGFLGTAALVAALFHRAATGVDRLDDRQRKATRIR